MTSSKNGVHVLVFPFPAQGHMLPLLDLTHQLSLKGLAITIIITPKNLPILAQLLAVNPSIQTLVLPFPNSPLIPHGVEHVKDLGNYGNIPIMAALSKLQDHIVQWFECQSNPPVALLSDFFLGWTHGLAQRLKVPRITFYSSGAFLTAVLDHLWGNAESLEPKCEMKFQDLPRAPSLTWEHAPSLFRRYRESEFTNQDLELVRASMVANSLSWASVVNTFEALEDEFLDFLRKKMAPCLFYSVGPLHLMSGPNHLGGNDEKVDTCDGVFSWLDRCDDGSVLYVCFGSQKFLKNAQMDALAIGLENSGVKFVWVVKPPSVQQLADGYGLVPNGFEERVLGQGVVIKGWAPQVSLLNHRAVGGFMSHCGWNSLLEAVAAGVMILGWPMEADQFVNAKLMVDYKEVAIRVCEGGNTVPDGAELARKIAESMRVDGIQMLRAKELRNKALEAIKDGGSSSSDLNGIVQEIAQLKVASV